MHACIAQSRADVLEAFNDTPDSHRIVKYLDLLQKTTEAGKTDLSNLCCWQSFDGHKDNGAITEMLTLHRPVFITFHTIHSQRLYATSFECEYPPASIWTNLAYVMFCFEAA